MHNLGLISILNMSNVHEFILKHSFCIIAFSTLAVREFCDRLTIARFYFKQFIGFFLAQTISITYTPFEEKHDFAQNDAHVSQTFTT